LTKKSVKESPVTIHDSIVSTGEFIDTANNGMFIQKEFGRKAKLKEFN
jgi:hypothetical protein